MIRALHELSSLDGGGVAKLLFDYYSRMDHEKVHFDFIIYSYYEEGIYEAPLKAMGCRIHKLPVLKKNATQCMKKMQSIIKNGNYDVVHTHRGGSGVFLLSIAWRCGVKHRLAHSHIAFEQLTFKQQVIQSIKIHITKALATELLACGRDAGTYMWGQRAIRENKVHVMTNAVDTELFKFSATKRDQYRTEMGITDKFVVGTVGRLSEQKNYPFLFQIFKSYLSINQNSLLLVVGRGEDEDKLKKLACDLQINESVLFLGVRTDVPDLLNCMDVFMLPSLYEGLPVVLVEAQANGIEIIMSNKVTNEMNVSDLISVLPIDKSEDVLLWVNELHKKCGKNTTNRENYSKVIKNAGYDITLAAKEMESFYGKIGEK